MARLILLLSIVVVSSWACTPPAPSSGGGGGKAASKKKRAVNEAHALVVTTYNYYPEMIDTYMKAVKAAGEKYAAENGVLDFDEVVEEKPENVGGKFAISYTILGVELQRGIT
ncbi:hypothetical protein COOONC_24750 [Cooperia oncophora]